MGMKDDSASLRSADNKSVLTARRTMGSLYLRVHGRIGGLLFLFRTKVTPSVPVLQSGSTALRQGKWTQKWLSASHHRALGGAAVHHGRGGRLLSRVNGEPPKAPHSPDALPRLSRWATMPLLCTLKVCSHLARPKVVV